MCFPTQDTDLVPSDIAAGFTLLHQQQDNISHSREPPEVVIHTPGQPQVMIKPTSDIHASVWIFRGIQPKLGRGHSGGL